MSMSDADMVDFRNAVVGDLEAIVAMCRDDAQPQAAPLDPSHLESYRRVFERIDADSAHRLVVGIFHGEPVCCAQLSILPGFIPVGAPPADVATVPWRAQIEGVVVASAMRGRGIGYVLVDHLMAEARRAGAQMVQVTSDHGSLDAHRFYERLGFVANHAGMQRLL